MSHQAQYVVVEVPFRQRPWELQAAPGFWLVPKQEEEVVDALLAALGPTPRASGVDNADVLTRLGDLENLLTKTVEVVETSFVGSGRAQPAGPKAQ